MPVCNIESLRSCGQAVVFLFLASLAHAAEPRVATVHLRGGEFVTGEWIDTEDGEIVRWRHNAFTRPFEFPATLVESVTYDSVESTGKPEGAFAVDFLNGDRLYGDWVGGNPESFHFDCRRWGVISIQRDAIRRISRWNAGERLIYNGPHSLDDWDETDDGEPEAWSMMGTRLATDAADKQITGACGLTPQSTINLELEWKGKPNFVVALGVDADRGNDRGAARLEVWDGQLVLLRELASKADVASVQSLGKQSGTLKLTIFLDQPAGQAVVVSATGEKLAEISLPSPTAKTNSSIRFKNVRGELQIRQLLVLRGHDQSMMQGASSEARVVKADGQTLIGDVKSVDSDAQEINIASDGEPVTIPLGQVDSWYGSASDRADPNPAAAAPATTARLDADDSTRVSGVLQRVADRQVWIQPAAIEEPISFSLDRLREVTITVAGKATFGELPGRTGWLELEEVYLRGALVDRENEVAVEGDAPEAAPETPATFAWQARSAANIVGLIDETSGRIVYRELPPPADKPTQEEIDEQRARRPQGFLGGLGAFFSGEVVLPEASQRSLTLRTGDTVNAKVDGIDGERVSIRSTKGEASEVKGEHVKAVELVAGHALEIEPEKRTRLLTVPRMLRNDPPTHIIVSTNGDFLRGRLLSMDEESLQFETRLRTMTIPRRLVARAIWLHPTAPDPTQPPVETPPSSDPKEAEKSFQVQVVRHDRTRLTFQPDRLEEGVLHGRSEALGPCTVPLDDTARLVLGSEIDEEVQDLPYGEWELVYAPDPTVFSEDGSPGSGPPPGTASELVGQPAPAIQLQRLDGNDFQLTELRGQVVVLDFWASWCAPCMQAMPQIDATVNAVADQGVELISINLQESPEQIEAALERLGIAPTVVLDRDGAVAARYHANAIPQTVVIDRDGNIARLFVGAGAGFAEKLGAAIEETLGL